MKEHTGTGKKGQFFIFSSVIILLVLYSITHTLNVGWKSDASEVQGNDAAEMLENIADGINKTIDISSASDIEENLNTLMLAERGAAGETYTLDYYFNISYPNVTANITISSKTFYASKLMAFER